VSLGLRLFLGYLVVVIAAGVAFYREFSAELVPGMRQSLEEALVDTANLIAEQVALPLAEGRLDDGRFATDLRHYSERRLNARIWDQSRRLPDLFIYITDAQGRVVFDSRGRDLGADYSRWNDVYRTLRGEYGARTSRDDPYDPSSSIMYVAAPVLHQGQLIGVLTVGKPSRSVQPYIDQMRDRLLEKGTALVLLALLLAALLSFGLAHAVGRLTAYARAVQAGQRATPPRLRAPELAQLAEAMEAMRRELEGKDYVERYLHTLTHELKSPIAAIQGASELLREPMPEADRQRFLGNIHQEGLRMQQVVERLLGLATLEKRQGLQGVSTIHSEALLDELLASRAPQLHARGLQVVRDTAPCTLQGERFLLLQALGNLLDNAIDFSPHGATLTLRSECDPRAWQLSLHDQGPGVPTYATERIFERFYTLPRPDAGPRPPHHSGLGLPFVRESLRLHGGEVIVRNHAEGGTEARLRLPLHPPLT